MNPPNVQSIHGFAAKVTYLCVLDQIRASGHVSATITDPNKLASPGTLSTDSVTVNIGQPQYVYNCTGDPSVNDVDFTLLQHNTPRPAAAPIARPGTVATSLSRPLNFAARTEIDHSKMQPTQMTVHAYSFDDAVLQAGSAVTLTGPAAHLDIVQFDTIQKKKTSDSKLISPRISATFSDTGETLSDARAEDGAQFVFTMPTASGLAEQSYSGFASSLEYRLLPPSAAPAAALPATGLKAPQQQDQQIDMMGRLSIKVVNPEEFSEPGRVEGLDGKILQLTVSNGVAHYSWDGASNSITMLFRPIQQAAKLGPEQPNGTKLNTREKAQ
jgi:hypothetical protein